MVNATLFRRKTKFKIVKPLFSPIWDQFSNSCLVEMWNEPTSTQCPRTENLPNITHFSVMRSGDRFTSLKMLLIKLSSVKTFKIKVWRRDKKSFGINLCFWKQKEEICTEGKYVQKGWMENEKNEIIFYKKYELLEFVFAGPINENIN